MRRLGSDHHGVWLGARRGTAVRRGDEPAILSGAFALLIPRHDWWTAVWNEPAPQSPFHYEVYADICTPAHWEPRRVTLIDLDLDVARTPAGETRLLDAAEFQEHRVAYGYPAEVVTAAQTAAAALMERMAARTEPFGAVGASYLELAREMAAPAGQR